MLHVILLLSFNNLAIAGVGRAVCSWLHMFVTFVMLQCLLPLTREMDLPVFVCLSVSKITQKRVHGFG